MESSLRDPILFPNWVWLLGAVLMVIALAWGIGLFIAYRRSHVMSKPTLQSLSQIRRQRYHRLIDQVDQEYRDGTLSPREAHLAVAAIIRAAASERLGANVESTTVKEARQGLSHWPQLVSALEWCEEPSFALTSDPEADAQVQIGLDAVRGIVTQ